MGEWKTEIDSRPSSPERAGTSLSDWIITILPGSRPEPRDRPADRPAARPKPKAPRVEAPEMESSPKVKLCQEEISRLSQPIKDALATAPKSVSLPGLKLNDASAETVVKELEKGAVKGCATRHPLNRLSILQPEGKSYMAFYNKAFAFLYSSDPALRGPALDNLGELRERAFHGKR